MGQFYCQTFAHALLRNPSLKILFLGGFFRDRCPYGYLPNRFRFRHHCTVHEELNDQLKQFWEIEKVPRRISLSPEEIRCENHFAATHSCASNGRYIVKLPFKTDPPLSLGESRSLTLTRLRAIWIAFKITTRLRGGISRLLTWVRKLRAHDSNIVSRQIHWSDCLPSSSCRHTRACNDAFVRRFQYISSDVKWIIIKWPPIDWTKNYKLTYRQF